MTLFRNILAAMTATMLLVSLAVITPRNGEVVQTQAVASNSWNGDFDTGGVPHGSNGKACGTGSADGPDRAADQYGSVQEMGNTACTSSVAFVKGHSRNSGSSRAARIIMGAHQQRELLQSKFSWKPDAVGTSNLWYGFSIYLDAKSWAGYKNELSGTKWNDPVGFRTQGANGSLNFSSDTNNSNAVKGQTVKSYSNGPHWSLRRNTVRNQQGFYKDGKGLDKIDLGPVVTGRWVDFVVHVRWSTTTKNAVREVWRNGVLKGRKTTRNAVDTLPHHLRVGQYQETNIPHSRTTYFDNVRIGASYKAVNPAVNR